jgi:hypothetical protein
MELLGHGDEVAQLPQLDVLEMLIASPYHGQSGSVLDARRLWSYRAPPVMGTTFERLEYSWVSPRSRGLPPCDHRLAVVMERPYGGELRWSSQVWPALIWPPSPCSPAPAIRLIECAVDGHGRRVIEHEATIRVEAAARAVDLAHVSLGGVSGRH